MTYAKKVVTDVFLSEFFRKYLLIFIGALTFSLPSGAQSSSDALADFLLRLKQLQSLESSFVQTTRDTSGRILQQMSGSLTVAKPGKMRWQTDAPFEQLVVSDGKLIWIYDMDLEQVTIRDMDQRVQETPALLLSGSTADVEKSFVVAKEMASNEIIFQLVPKDPSQLFESLEFHYQGKNLKRMMIYDAAGQVTEISFSAANVNTAVDPAAFIFDVPEGVDVIDGRHGI
ncbi:outer membrane lipoprotein chaperone LolA [Thalassolituus sp. C2-1]|uniref:outer membrane lipoprotein chaperone LolA n=1 Tax=Venatorbacter sp. C2-1 TaxID=2597518 RepID=UPI00164490B8|nr:outer membrane lipoprotein chaperone LolA [Thalassolituus sp. C2-1]